MKVRRFLLLLILFVTGIQPVCADVSLEVKVLLQGAYDSATGLMRDDLRRKGYLPGVGEPLTYSGAEVASEDVLAATDENAVVDWITLELRDATDHTLLYARRGLLVQRNGQVIVANGGAKNIVFEGVTPGNYRVSIQHRNHLGVMSENAVALTANSQLLDFSDPAFPVQGDALSRYVLGGKAMLWAGDADANTQLIVSGPNTDLNTLLGYVLTEPANTQQDSNFRVNGYFNTDLNLDGVTIYAGPGTDASLLIGNVLMHANNQAANLNYVVSIPQAEVISPLVNIAKQYGEATQNAVPQGTGCSGNCSAALAIDGDWGTASQSDYVGDDWWQLKLPTAVNIAGIVIYGENHPTLYGLMDGVTVYVSDTPYNGVLSDAEKVATLDGAFMNSIALNPARNGTYVIIKATSNNYLGMSEVAVYAQIPSAPVFEKTQYSFNISGQISQDSIVGTVRAVDYQGNNLVYSLEGAVPFYVDGEGVIRVNGVLQAGHAYDFVLVASAGDQVSRVPVVVDVADAVEEALLSGSVAKVTDVELLDAALATIADNKNLLLDAKVKLFNLNTDGTAKSDGTSLTNITWDPTHDASVLLSTYGMNTPVLLTNSAVDGYTVYEQEIGIIGEQGSRYMVLGGNPMRNYRRDNTSINVQMQQFMENGLSWLTARDDLKSRPFKVVAAHMDDSYYFPDERAVREWLDTHYPEQVSYNTADACDDTALVLCLAADPDLLVISQKMNESTDPAQVASTIQAAMLRGIPVLYLHLDGGMTDLGKSLLPFFNVTYHWDNYWKKLKLSAFDIIAYLYKTPVEISAIHTLLQHFKTHDYAFDWSACVGENCSAVSGLDDEFQQGASAVRAMMNALDSSKFNVFLQEGFRLQKLLALLGDSYRQFVKFPMDKVKTDDTDFMESYFADHAVYNYRLVNPVQPDMGSFSRSDFSHITPVSRTVDLQSKVNFRSAGVYALPGQTVRVTRLDSSNLTVKVFVNTQRSGSTHQWAENGYSRPKYLQSPQMEVKSGETIVFTSPYGGPLQVAFSANDLPVQLRFENVGEHPYWRSNADDASFTTKLAAGEYDWAELATPGFEVHSALEKMRESVVNWDSADNLAAKTMRHLHNFPHVLAGFQGPGIDTVPEIHGFATAKGITIETLDTVKHMNADQASCGYGCSGNPYDAYWAFDAIGHGDIHELGHGLEKARFRFDGWEGHSTTNPYSYYSKTQYYKETGIDPVCQSLPFESIFENLQMSVGQADPMAYLQTNLWSASNWSHQVSMTIEMMMTAQYQGVLQDGWHLLARLHILERAFNKALSSETNWLATRDRLGFSDYTLTEAQAISNNDWLVISISWGSDLDYRDYIRMWGLDFSAKASSQVAGFDYPVAQRRFFISSPTGYCRGEGFDGVNLPVDGAQVWPL